MKRTLTAALALLGLMAAAAGSAAAETLYGLSSLTFSGQTLYSFDSAAPGAISAAVPITGLAENDDLLGIDFRPATGQLYGLGFSNNLYTIDTVTGAATLAAPLVGAGGRIALAGLDFNPAGDFLRIVTVQQQGQPLRNLRVDADTGRATIQGVPAYAPGDPFFGQMPAVAGLAYANNVAGASTTALYGIDIRGRLVRQEPENQGLLTTVGPLGAGISLAPNFLGFDISGLTGTAYAALTPPSPSAEPQPSRLYTIDLGTGAATLVGVVGDGTAPIQLVGLAAPVEVIPEPGTLLLLGTGLLGAGAAAVRRRRRAGAGAAA